MNNHRHFVTVFLSAIVLFAITFSPGNAISKVYKIKVAKDSLPADLTILYKEYPELVQHLFERLDMQYPGLEKVKTLVIQKKWVEACSALVDYYKKKSEHHYLWLRDDAGNIHDDISNADDVVKNIFTFQEVKAQQEVRKNGQLNWYYTGPRNDREWGYFLNRQGYFNDLLSAYKSTGTTVYAKKFNDLVSDWVLTNPLPKEKVSTVTWRELEVGLRLTSGNWPRTFYGFQPAAAFSEVGRILMLSSVPEQADYLVHYHRMHSNWAAMELNGLASAAFYWPEFKRAPVWLQHATEKMKEEVQYEVYADGVQNELSSHYHQVAMNNFEQFADLSKRNGNKLPAMFLSTLQKMHNYIAYTMRPDGHGLLNNDSNLDYTRDGILKAAGKFNRPDWKFIATNGREGKEPEEGASIFFPWAGQMVMRNGWYKGAAWSFFDVGPWGNGHQHNDKLHLSVAAFGHDWLVDAGRYYYKRDKWRKYFLSSASHNVILVDGKGQRPYKKLAASPVTKDVSIQKDIDFCMASYAGGFGSDWWSRDAIDKKVIPARHTRAVLYLHDKYWVVFDHLSSEKGRIIEPLWHFAPECKVTTDGASVLATDTGNGTLQIIPAIPSQWQIKLVKGQEHPDIQGWYSKTYNEKIPAYCVRYQTTSVDTASVFAWVICPSEAGKQQVKITRLSAPSGAYRMNISIPGQPLVEVAIRFYGDEAVPLSSSLSLEGRCAVVVKGRPPVVACGVIRNEDGRIVVADHTAVH